MLDELGAAVLGELGAALLDELGAALLDELAWSVGQKAARVDASRGMAAINDAFVSCSLDASKPSNMPACG